MRNKRIEFQRDEHGLHQVVFHLIWVTKWRLGVMVDAVAKDCAWLIRQECLEQGWTLSGLYVGRNFVHLQVQVFPVTSAAQVVYALERATSDVLRDRYPQLRKLPALWSGSPLVASVGVVPISLVNTFIAEGGFTERVGAVSDEPIWLASRATAEVDGSVVAKTELTSFENRTRFLRIVRDMCHGVMSVKEVYGFVKDVWEVSLRELEVIYSAILVDAEYAGGCLRLDGAEYSVTHGRTRGWRLERVIAPTVRERKVAKEVVTVPVPTIRPVEAVVEEGLLCAANRLRYLRLARDNREGSLAARSMKELVRDEWALSIRELAKIAAVLVSEGDAAGGVIFDSVRYNLVKRPSGGWFLNLESALAIEH